MLEFNVVVKKKNLYVNRHGQRQGKSAYAITKKHGVSHVTASACFGGYDYVFF
jgi:hypothetical protein